MSSSHPRRRERYTDDKGRPVPGIYFRVNAQGKQVFEIGFRDAQGKQRFRTVAGGITAARAALADEHARRNRHEPMPADRRLTFNKAADLWWAERACRLRPATQAVYAAALKHLRPAFGRARLIDIGSGAVARYVVSKHGPCKSATVRSHLSVLGAVYSHAARHHGYVGPNPVSVLDRVERPSRDDEKPKRVLNRDELGRLIAAVAHTHRLLFEFAAETGGRLSECLGLTWKDIDFEAESIRFEFQLSKEGKRVPLKTRRSRRTLEVTPTLIAKLREHRRSTPYSGDHAFVFASRAGTGLDQGNIGQRVLKRAVTAAGLDAIEVAGEVVVPAPTFHSLRHSHASALIAQGWDVAEASARLGHASTAITMQTYVHEFDAAARSTARRSRLAALYSQGGGQDHESVSIVSAQDRNQAQDAAEAPAAEVVDLQAIRNTRQQPAAATH
jgi:integrase